MLRLHSLYLLNADVIAQSFLIVPRGPRESAFARLLEIGCDSVDIGSVRHSLKLKWGSITMEQRPGLGVEIDMAEVEKAHKLCEDTGLEGRDDAAAMQYLIPQWTFDPKRPCLAGWRS